jgi:hypothetical protein
MNTHEKGKHQILFATHAVIYQGFFGEASTHFLFSYLIGIGIYFKKFLM